MKVLIINSVCGYGSTGRICTGIQSVLKENGHDSLICYGRGRAPLNVKSYRIGTETDVTVHGIVSRFNDKHGLYSKTATKCLIEKIKQYSPDVINLHNIHGYYVNYKLLFEFLKNYNRPVVWTFHDCWAFTGHCAHFYNNNCDKWMTGCKECSFKSSYPKTVGFSNSAKNYQLKKSLFTDIKNLVIVSPSKWLGELASKSFFCDNDIRIINNGINLSDFKPVESNFRQRYGFENKKIILGVSNAWGHLKGLDTFNRLAEELSDDYKIVLVGITDKNKKKLSNKILSIKKTADVKELAQIYSAADMYVNPTLQDNFPTVNIEALACATPVITYDSGGSAEMLDDNTGIVIERNNYKALKEAILNFDSFNLSPEACVQKAQNYNQLLKFNEYKDLYDELFEE